MAMTVKIRRNPSLHYFSIHNLSYFILYFCILQTMWSIFRSYFSQSINALKIENFLAEVIWTVLWHKHLSFSLYLCYNLLVRNLNIIYFFYGIFFSKIKENLCELKIEKWKWIEFHCIFFSTLRCLLFLWCFVTGGMNGKPQCVAQDF